MNQARVMIVSQPNLWLREHMRAKVHALGLDDELGWRLFAPPHWHQTLCGPFDTCEQALLALMAAGDAAQAEQPAFELSFNRIRGDKGEHIHWSFQACGRPKPFDHMQETLQAELKPFGLKDGGHRPHITISYRAPYGLPTLPIGPLDWLIDEIQLVERSGSGKDFHYEVLHRWALKPPAMPRPEQLKLFH